jgi:PIN domain nuclease of toxin-antitoxin system
LVDSGRLSVQVFEDARSTVDGEAFTVVPLDLPIIDKMALISRNVVFDPFDRIIAATALAIDLPLVTADERIHESLGNQAVW